MFAKGYVGRTRRKIMTLLFCCAMSFTGCQRTEIIYLDNTEVWHPVHEGETIEAPWDGWLISVPEFERILKGR